MGQRRDLKGNQNKIDLNENEYAAYQILVGVIKNSA